MLLRLQIMLGNFTKQENQEIAFISQVINETINELLGMIRIYG